MLKRVNRAPLQRFNSSTHYDMKNVIIAIDGTSASGKSTNAKLVARALGFVYVDTGAMYRTLAWHCLKHHIDPHDGKAVAAACKTGSSPSSRMRSFASSDPLMRSARSVGCAPMNSGRGSPW